MAPSSDRAGVVARENLEQIQFAVTAEVVSLGGDARTRWRRAGVCSMSTVTPTEFSPSPSAGIIARAAASSMSAIMREVAYTAGNVSLVLSPTLSARSASSTIDVAVPQVPTASSGLLMRGVGGRQMFLRLRGRSPATQLQSVTVSPLCRRTSSDSFASASMRRAATIRWSRA